MRHKGVGGGGEGGGGRRRRGAVSDIRANLPVGSSEGVMRDGGMTESDTSGVSRSVG